MPTNKRIIFQGCSVLVSVIYCLCISGCLSNGRKENATIVEFMKHRQGLYEDSARITKLETLQVGDLPLSATNLIEYFVWFNEKVNNAGLPHNCCLGIRDIVISRWSANMMNEDMIIWAVENNPIWFHELGIATPNAQTIKHDLENLNMRDFLWLLQGVYSLKIEYDVSSIMLGYGWGVDHVITRSNRDGVSK